jgi:hypothetical protein
VGDLLGRSQPATLTITTLDKALNVTRNVANETTPEFEVEVVIIA